MRGAAKRRNENRHEARGSPWQQGFRLKNNYKLGAGACRLKGAVQSHREGIGSSLQGGKQQAASGRGLQAHKGRDTSQTVRVLVHLTGQGLSLHVCNPLLQPVEAVNQLRTRRFCRLQPPHLRHRQLRNGTQAGVLGEYSTTACIVMLPWESAG